MNEMHPLNIPVATQLQLIEQHTAALHALSYIDMLHVNSNGMFIKSDDALQVEQYLSGLVASQYTCGN